MQTKKNAWKKFVLCAICVFVLVFSQTPKVSMAGVSKQMPALTKAPSIVGVWTKDWEELDVRFSWMNTDEALEITRDLWWQGENEWVADHVDCYEGGDATFWLQASYSLDGGKTWFNSADIDETTRNGTWVRPFYQTEDWCVDLPFYSVGADYLTYSDADLLNLSFFYDDYADEKAAYFSQGKAKKLTTENEFDDWYTINLTATGSLKVKARYALSYSYYEEEYGDQIRNTIYSPWSSVYNYGSTVTPETLGFSRGGVFEAPVLLYYNANDYFYITVDPDDDLKKVIAQYDSLNYWDGVGRDYYDSYDMNWWYSFLELKINDGEWFHYKESDANVMLLDVRRTDLAEDLEDRYGILLQNSDHVYARVRLMSASTEWRRLDDSENSDERGIYYPTEECGFLTSYSNAIELPLDNQYRINYYLNNGSFEYGSEQIYAFKGDSKVVIDLTDENYIPSKYGYEFAGWYTTENFLAGTQITKIDTKKKQFYDIYAKWETPGEYSITYELGESGVINGNPSMYTPLMDDIELEDAYQSGIEFLGWYDNPNFAGERISTIKKGSYGDITLYAKWAYPEYTLTYALDGGTNAAKNPTKFQVNRNGGAEAELAAPTKTGFIFDGWFYDDQFRSSLSCDAEAKTWYFEGTENTTIYAKWIRGRWNITYVPVVDGKVDADFSPYNPNPDNYTYGSAVTLSALSHSGYTFGGWYSDAACTKKASTVSATATGAKTFYAKWTELTYTITYVLNSDEENSPAAATIANTNPEQRKYSVTVNLANASSSNTDYVFVGWYSNENLSGTPITNISGTGNKTVFAKWKRVYYNITYVLNGGTNSASNPAKYKLNDDETNNVALKPATRANYEFGGWYYDDTLQAGLKKESSGYTFKASVDITVYAKWTPKKYTVTYVHPSEVTGNTTVVNTTNPTYYYFGDAAVTLKNISAEGYTFEGWFTDAACTKPVTGIAKNASGNKTFYSKWTEKTIAVSFDANGGSKAPGVLNKGVWTTVNLPTALPVKTGYDFVSWNTRADGKGTDYKAGAAYDGRSAITLFAQWRLKFTDVKFGTWQYNTAKYVYDNKIIQGTTATTFSPDANLTRGQFIVMLWRMEGQPKVEFNAPYTDVADGKFYSTAIAWAKTKNLASGYADGSFKPDNKVTREQFMSFIYRYAKYKGYDVSTNGVTYTTCKDAAKVNKTFATPVEWGYERRFIGKTGELGAPNPITRIQAAAILQSFIEYYK